MSSLDHDDFTSSSTNGSDTGPTSYAVTDITQGDWDIDTDEMSKLQIGNPCFIQTAATIDAQTS